MKFAPDQCHGRDGNEKKEHHMSLESPDVGVVSLLLGRKKEKATMIKAWFLRRDGWKSKKKRTHFRHFLPLSKEWVQNVPLSWSSLIPPFPLLPSLSARRRTNSQRGEDLFFVEKEGEVFGGTQIIRINAARNRNHEGITLKPFLIKYSSVALNAYLLLGNGNWQKNQTA